MIAQPGKPISRPEMLKRIDEFLNLVVGRLSVEQRATLWEEIGEDQDVVTSVKTAGLSLTTDEERHLREDWFASWWPDAQPVAPIVARAFSEAVLEAAKDGRPVVTLFHTSERDDVQASIHTGEHQVTIIIHAPMFPTSPKDPGDVKHVRRENGPILVS